MDSGVIELDLKRIHEQIKNIRKEKSISQKELAKKANVSQQTVSAIERGKMDPSLKILLAILGVLGVSLLIKALSKKGGEK